MVTGSGGDREKKNRSSDWAGAGQAEFMSRPPSTPVVTSPRSMKTPQRILLTVMAGSLALLSATVPLLAAESSSAAEKKAPRVDPQAIAQLQRMSASLAAAKSFTFRSTGTHEVPSDTGQFLTLVGTADFAVRRPDKLRVKVGGEMPPFDFFYDGATALAWAPESRVFSTTKAPPTIDALLTGLKVETGLWFPTAPLLFSNPVKVLERGLTSAAVIGSVEVRGVPCIHLAFRSEGVNWEIWIESGSAALPRRLATTFTDRPNLPRSVVEFSRWHLNPWFGVGGFTFHPPSGAKEIPFLSSVKSESR